MIAYRAAHADLNDGAGPLRTIAYFAKESDARAAADMKEFWVQGAVPAEVERIEILESFAAWRDSRKRQLAERALNKLTKAEREALGL